MAAFLLTAQVSTSHSSPSLDFVRERLREARRVMPIPILITGANEVPEIFHDLTGPATRAAGEVYLWYNLLSGYPGQTNAERVINFRGEFCTGWGGWEEVGSSEVDETFVFGCPNNPQVRRKALAGLERLLRAYPFDGVFLDKFRFPSPANGLEMVFSCFCPFCQEKARQQGLDLEAVRAFLAGGLDAAALEAPLVQQFLRFRCRSITDLVAEVRALANGLGRKVALDLFTPLLAPLVGQDYAALAGLADWFKPMIYRQACGPAGFRLEVKALVDGLCRMVPTSIDAVLETASRFYPQVSRAAYDDLVARAAPLAWMEHEMSEAVRLLAPRPVLVGLETVRFPGVIEIDPAMVQEMAAAGLRSGVQGAVVSWDLLHTPLENIQAIQECVTARTGTGSSRPASAPSSPGG